MDSTHPLVLVYAALTMGNYFTLRIAGQPGRIIYADNEHVVAELTVIVARDMALHGYLDESAMVIAPVWNSAIRGHRHFSLDFVSSTISRFGLDLIWRGAGFVPIGLDSWVSRLDRLGYTEERIEMEQRMHFCASDSGATCTLYPGTSPTQPFWSVIRSMLAIWEDPNTRVLYSPLRETELDALSCLEACIGRESPNHPNMQEYRACILGVELSLKYGEPQLVYEFLSAIATQIVTVGPGAILIIGDLALSPRIGGIVRNNYMLRHATGFTVCRAREIAFEMVRALDSRFRWGEGRPYAGLSWVHLLSEIEVLESRIWDQGQESDLPFFRPPASPEQIAEVERELRAVLPQDYKEFLAVSNGLGSFNRSMVAPLLSVEDIFWDTSYGRLKVEYRQFESNTTLAQLPFLNRVLQVSDISYAEDAHWWLIEPHLVQAAKRCMGEGGPTEWLGLSYTEWQPHFSNRGSFRIMMERRLSYLAGEP